MIVIDVETSGVDPHKNSLLSIGAVDFEHPERQFYGECRAWEGAHIDDEALAVNGFSHAQATDHNKKTDRELLLDFLSWTESCQEKTIAGHNTSFDRDFLQATAARYHINWTFAHRTLDLHSIAYYHHIHRGVEIPTTHGHSGLNLDGILTYAGLPPEPEPHNGLTGAKLEAEAFSRFFNKKCLFSEYEGRKIPWLAAP